MPPSLIAQAELVLAQLIAIAAMQAADAEGNWKQLDAAITSAVTAKVDEPTIEPFRKRKAVLRAQARLTECLGMGEDGYTELQSVYDDAVKANLKGDDVEEARKLLELIKNAQRHFVGSFEKWMGGGFDHELWVDNPQFKLVMGTTDEDGFKVSVSVDKAGDAAYAEIGVHVLHVTTEGATQLGSKEGHEVVMQTEYVDTETAKGSFDGLPGATYFIVLSTKEPKQVGDFSITTVGVGEYELTEVKPLVQGAIKEAMKEQRFEALPGLVAQAEGSAAIGWHPSVVGAKLIGDMEGGWQAKDAAVMGPAIARAKASKVVDKPVLRLYAQRFKQLDIEGKLKSGLAGNMAQLLAAVDEAGLIGYSGELKKKGEAALKKFKKKLTLVNLFMDEQAAGAMKFGNWRQNPTYKLTVSKATTVYVAVNEDGELDAETQARVDAKAAKKEAAFEQARRAGIGCPAPQAPPRALRAPLAPPCAAPSPSGRGRAGAGKDGGRAGGGGRRREGRRAQGGGGRRDAHLSGAGGGAAHQAAEARGRRRRQAAAPRRARRAQHARVVDPRCALGLR